ncbi:MAG: hypothetical protein ABI999_05280 [Acidobacteriota bacterium]
MPISFQIDAAAKRIYTVATGVITYDDLRTHMNADVPAEVAVFPEIIDCSNATTDLMADQVRRLAAERERIANSRSGAGPVAVVATDDLFFGMLRMFDMLTSRVRPLQVFRNMTDAERWLDSIAAGIDPFAD